MTTIRHCVTCGSPITVTTRNPNRRFCSPRCRVADWHARNRATNNGVANDVHRSGHGCALITARSWAGCVSCGVQCGWPMRPARRGLGWPGPCFHLTLGDRDRGDLTQPQQPGQVRGVPGVGFDPIPSRADQFRWRCNRAVNVRLSQPGIWCGPVRMPARI